MEYDFEHVECDSLGLSGNISVNSCFCKPGTGDYSIGEESPCAPAISGGCGLIGAYDVGCVATSVPQGRTVETGWGMIKKMFK